MKLPLSVLVVVHTAKLDVLLLERAARGGFWQSVTGSLDAPGEPFELAAARELREETGIDAARGRLRRWNVAYTFEIYQRWRHRFAPGVTHNTEHLFSLELAELTPVTLAPHEHTASAWLPWREAARKCFSWSNRDAILMIGAALVTAGCASGGGGTLAPHLEAAPMEVRECARWYQALDAEIDAAGVRDAQYARLPGFPHLRVDRPLAALRDRAAQSDAALRAYAERLHELDLDARRHELQNLKAMSGETARAQSLRRARDCGTLLRGADLASAQSRAALLGAAKVPDDYSTGMRIFGLYYLTQIPFAAGVRRWEQDTREAFARAPDDARPRVRYAPPASPAVSRGAVSGLLARATFDPLGQLLLSPRELDRLAAAYAPSFEIEVGGDYDRFGWLRWRRGSDLPQVDASEPTVYVHASYTRYRDQVLLQLVYTIWFSERPRHGTVDLLAGRLDGLTWRVTLAPDGAPLIYDTIHPCGCYHMFFPTERARPRPAPDPESREEWAFVPQTLPEVADGERPVVTLASGTHYVERLALVRGPDSLVRYVLRSYDELRSLPRAAETASAFGPDGLIAGSERAERFFFWPMGIASAGAMRQWGRQATAFVGRRHFDDADLLEKRFELDL